jgi:FMN phosphatase YigB (HAD superfamily)
MLSIENIKAVGFDLDETLYPSNPDINKHIRNNLAKHIQGKLGMATLTEAREYFETQYKQLASSNKILLNIGFSSEEATVIAEECTGDPSIAHWLTVDPFTVQILKEIRARYKTFLITSSTETSAIAKLHALGIDPDLFQIQLYGNQYGHKTEGHPFQHVCVLSKIVNMLKPHEHVYIGNSRKADILPAKLAGMQTIAVWSDIIAHGGIKTG